MDQEIEFDALPPSFYVTLDETTYRATAATMSPWDSRSQHGGPPSALAAHALERAFPRPELHTARLVIDFLGAIPLGDITVRSEIVRPGRRIELSRTILSSGGRDVVTAHAWRIATRSDVPVPDAVSQREADAPLPPLPAAQVYESFVGLESWAYGRAIEWRFTRGGLRKKGPGEVWSRPRLPLVDGRTASPLERLALVADSANGISQELEMRRFAFIPPSIALTLHRYPAGEWTFLGATTEIGPNGIGYTTCTLGDERGRLGVATQPLLLEAR